MEEALKLPPEARAILADALLESVESAENGDVVEKEWRVEIERRLGDLDSGAVNLVPWSEAQRRIFGSDVE